ISRPPRRNPAATKSIARAICGRARRTASATTASSALIRLAISSEDLRSRSLASGCDCSVRRRRRSPVCFSFLAFKNVLSDSSVQGLDYRVVKFWPNLFDRPIRTVGPSPVRQQDYRKFTHRVDPQRGSGIAEVTVGQGRKIFPGLRGRRRPIPPQRPRSASRRGFPPREETDRLGTQNRSSPTQQGMREASYILCGRKNSRLPRDPAEHTGIFILPFALNNALSKSAIVLRRRNCSAGLRRRIVSGVRHAQRT